ncbi:Uncharacterised protein [Mannheimia haemolytica]|uniref:Uncharacterized protein n=1 Tax=Mannheimia haemolytica TaxID=75985 RepID=A0A378N826_MANHA|nr:Uncharacterised protein [Mannheimia haemolytica]
MNPLEPKPEEIAKENNGYALEDLKDGRRQHHREKRRTIIQLYTNA